MNALTKKLTMTAATLMLALGVTTIQVNQAQAGKGGRIIAGAIAGAALLAIIGSDRSHARGHRSHRRYGRHKVCYDRWGDPYRCHRSYGKRKHWRKNRRHRDHW